MEKKNRVQGENHLKVVVINTPQLKCEARIRTQAPQWLEPSNFSTDSISVQMDSGRISTERRESLVNTNAFSNLFDFLLISNALIESSVSTLSFLTTWR